MARYNSISGLGDKFKAVLKSILKFFLYVFLIILAIVIIKGILKKDELVIQPISPPKAFVESGYQGNIIAERLNEEIIALYENASTVRNDSTAINVDQSKDINMNVMGLGVSATNIIYHLRDLLGVPTNYISGHLTDMDKVLCLKLSLSNPSSSRTIRLPYKENDKLVVFDSLLFEGAKFITEIKNPYRLAVFYHQNNKSEEALNVIRKLVKSPGEKKWAFNLWANIIKNKYGPLESVEFYNNALREDPEFILANRNLAYTYLSIDSLSLAEQYLEKALTMEPDNWQTVNTAAWVKRRLGQTEDAIDLYEQNLKFHPMNLHSYSNYGGMLMDLDKEEELTVLFQKAQDQNFENDEFYLIKSNYFAYQEKIDSAEYFVDKALIFNPTNIDALATKANVIYERDGWIPVIPHMKRVIDRFEELKFIGDGYISSLNSLSMSYYHAEKMDSSFYYINKAIDLAPNAAILYTTLAEAHYLSGNKEKFYENIIIALDMGYRFGEDWQEDVPYNQLKNDKRLLSIFEKYNNLPDRGDG
jgi:tetratricopeptide (TPR) repeat protein